MSIAKHRELLVLSTLHAHPMHGYALVEVLEKGLGQAVGLKRSAVYAILKRLEERGWIHAQSEREGKLPPRAVFETTAQGEAALPELTRACFAHHAGTQTPLAALLPHLDNLPPEAQQAFLQRLLSERRDKLASLADFDGHTGPAGLAFKLIEGHLAVEIRILEQALAEARPPKAQHSG